MNNEYKYVRLCQGVASKGILILESEVANHLDNDKDWYQSIYYYTEKHLGQFKKTNSVRGIKDVQSNKLVFDFDNKAEPLLAKEDALVLCERLLKAGINANELEIYFSGNKGFNVIITFDYLMTPYEVGTLALMFAKDLKTFDPSLYDAPQILRIPGTKHQESGLYKVPLSLRELEELDIDLIKKRARSLDNIPEFEWNVCSKTFPMPAPKEEKKQPYGIQFTIDWIKKPKQWKNCKWSLLQGNFMSGERHMALTVLAATCRGLGFDKETTYYMCKSALKKQAASKGQEEFDKSELWTNIIEDSIFSDNWEGGQYTCKSDPWLQNYCANLGEHKCGDKDDDAPVVKLDDMTTQFVDYASNFEQNVIKTGLIELDNNVMLVASTLNGLLGQPGAGKTSMALNYLRHTSKMEIPSMFLSLDMALPIIYSKLAQTLTGYDFKKVLSIYKENPKLGNEITEKIKKDYNNVGFNFKSGLTIPDIKNIITEQQDRIGKQVKLVVVDYLECLAGPYSDSIANTGFIANQLKDVANEMGVCILLLLQTQKHSTPDIADPLLSLKGVKGSSVIEQSCSTILTLWREGYNPDTVDDDRYISFAVVKNRFGSLWRGDFAWEGVSGKIGSLTEEQRYQLKQFKNEKILAKIEQAKNEAKWD